jgi:LmbE family N-acetylglucosaminyl deacetylase
MVSIVAVGCHPDDVESGCFGTLALYRKNGATVKVLLLTGGEKGGDKEFRLNAAQSACSVIDATLAYAGFEDGNVEDKAETVSWIEKEIKKAEADIVFAPCPSDRHQDHRKGGRATLSATRKTVNVLLYETPTTLRFEPQMYVDIAQTIELKIRAMALHKPPEEQLLTSDAIKCLAKLRAYKLRRVAGEFEAFEVVKWELKPEKNKKIIVV